MRRLKAFLSTTWPLLLTAAAVALALAYFSPTAATITLVSLGAIVVLFSAARYNARGKEVR